MFKDRTITCPLCLRRYTRPVWVWLLFGTPVAHPSNHPDCQDDLTATSDEVRQSTEIAGNRRLADLFAYIVPDGPKMLRETLCVAQARIGNSPYDEGRKREHIERLQRLIDECDRMRPTGSDGKHGDRHTPECGCEGNPLGGPSGRDRRISTPPG